MCVPTSFLHLQVAIAAQPPAAADRTPHVTHASRLLILHTTRLSICTASAVFTSPAIAPITGGFRAVTLALGYVRALHMMNLTQQARFLSSNSGGSWFNAAFSYQSVMPVNTFLGPYVPPQDLSMGALGNTSKGAQGAFATTISEGSILAKGVAGAHQSKVGPLQPIILQRCAPLTQISKGSAAEVT